MNQVTWEKHAIYDKVWWGKLKHYFLGLMEIEEGEFDLCIFSDGNDYVSMTFQSKEEVNQYLDEFNNKVILAM